MGYTVDYSTMQAILGTYREMTGRWNSEISSVMEKTQAIVTSTNIAGNKANNMKQYLAMVYSCMRDSLVVLLELFWQSYLIYVEDYYTRIDDERDAHIDTDELSRLHASLQGKRGVFQHIGINAENSVSKVSDLVSTPSLDIGELDQKTESVLKSLDDLYTNINELESEHVSADFEEIDAMISKLNAFIIELYNQKKIFKTGFSPATLFTLTSVPELLSATKNAGGRLSGMQSNVAAAMTNLEKRLEQERKELEERQRKVKWAKAAVAIVTTVTVAACVASGVGTLIVPVICAVGKSAFDAAADEYATHGWDTSQWNSAYIEKEAVKGWFSGFTGAILPPGAGEFAKAGLSSANSALWGGLDSAYDQMAATGRITDTKSIWFDTEKSGVSSFIGELAGNVVSDKVKDMPIGLGLDKYTNPSNDIRHYVGEFIVGGTDKVSSGIVERGISTTVEVAYDVERNYVHGESALEGIDLGDRYKDVMSFDKIALDFVKGGSKEVVSSYITERKPDPKTGLTPIIQAKLAYETDPETGLTGIVQDSLSHIVDEDQFSDILREMEERNPSESNSAAGAATDDPLTGGDSGMADTIDDYKYGDSPGLNRESQSTDWEYTASTPEEIRQIEEMDKNSEFDVRPSDVRSASYRVDNMDTSHAEDSLQSNSESRATPDFPEAIRDPDLFTSSNEKDYSYESDRLGKRASGTLGIEDNPSRDPVAQRRAGGDERRSTDDGGHLIGARFGGSPGEENLDAQDRNLNRGSYKKRENQWAESLNKGDNVYAHVETYKHDGAERPDAYMGWTVTEHPDGSREWDAFSYTNESAETQEQWEKELEDL